MKKLLIALALLVLIPSFLAYDLNGPCTDPTGMGDYNAMGDCIMKGSFGGDPRLFGIILLLLFAGFAFAARAPLGVTLAVGLIITFSLIDVGMNFPEANFVINMIVLITGVLVALGIIHFVRR